MIRTATAMREAFNKAARTSSPTEVQAQVKSALRRKVGTVRRNKLWSVQRGKR